MENQTPLCFFLPQSSDVRKICKIISSVTGYDTECPFLPCTEKCLIILYQKEIKEINKSNNDLTQKFYNLGFLIKKEENERTKEIENRDPTEY